MTLGKDNQGILSTILKLPFVVDEDEKSPRVAIELPDKPGDTPLVELVEWTVSQVDKELETCVLSCSLSVDSDKLYKMKELPLIQIEVKTKDGLKSHKHDVMLERGIFPTPPFALFQSSAAFACPCGEKVTEHDLENVALFS